MILLRRISLRMTLPELWTFLAIALPVLAALLAPLPTVDLAYQLRAGAQILAGGGIPTVDTWTFTAYGRPWLDQQWGAQVLLAAAWSTTGWTGLVLLRAALVGAIAWLVLATIRRRASGLQARTSALLALGAFVVMAPALALRPQLFGMALFAASLALLSFRRERRAGLWALPVVAAAWANLHGSFVLAPVLVGFALLEDLADRSPGSRRTLVVLLVTAAATLLTPFGIGAWRYATALAANPDVTRRVSEWQPPALTDVPGLLFWGSVVFVAVAGAVERRRRRAAVPWPALLALLAFAVLGANTGRGIAWWSMVAVMTVAPVFANGRSSEVSPPPRPSRINSAVAVALVLAGIALLPAWRPLDPGLGAPSGTLSYAPSGITAALREVATPADRVWNPQTWGSWLEFAVPAPAYALDSRIEVFPPQVWVNAEVIDAAGPGWDALLDAAGVTIVATSGPADAPLANALVASPGWTLYYADVDGAVWRRVTP
jgi:hypothetical protein